MNVKKVLLVNDDPNDVAALARRMPANIETVAASQREARDMKSVDAGLIILDNDANNRQKAKGPQTLWRLRQLAWNVPIVYTSHLPARVGSEVRDTRLVTVVQTDRLADHLAQAHGIALRRPGRRAPGKDEVRVSLILSYNPVDGYPQGIYGDGKLVVLSYDRMAKGKAKQVLREKMDKIYERFSWNWDRRMIRNIFIYDGINGGEMPGELAATLAHDTRIRVNLLACGCEWGRKFQVARSMGLDLWQVECGGKRSLGMIADMVLGLKRAHVDYGALSMPKTRILRPAERAS
jgi:hypothetical protein